MTDHIANLTDQIAHLLRFKGLMLVTAESCTGGGIAQALTEMPGSSEWFDCGFVTYSNTSKIELLDVSAALIAQHGAVSEEVAEAMARGALDNSNAQIALSTTGIAGPTGGMPGKPVGTVCFGWASKKEVRTERLIFEGDRASIREQTITYSLQKLLTFLSTLE